MLGKIGIAGAGNLACVLCKALINKEISPYCIYIRDKFKVDDLARELGVRVVSDINELMDCDIVIVAVKDDAIEEVAAKLSGFHGLLLHTSGIKSMDALLPVERRGVFYPLQTFSKGKKIDYRTTPILINCVTSEDLSLLKDFASVLFATVYHCDDEKRKKIHLAAVFMCNFVDVMMGIGTDLLNAENLSLALMKPLVMETMDKIFMTNPHDALTGPARRKDFGTIAMHREMLKNSQDELEIYDILTDYILKRF